jgi:hypothetical protein
MARKKRNSPALNKANTRLSSLKAIDENLDLGNGFTVTEYESRITATKKKLDDHNGRLSSLDGDLNKLQASETELNDYSDRILAAVGVKFGRDSSEYEEAGGTRKSERKRKNGTTDGDGDTTPH